MPGEAMAREIGETAGALRSHGDRWVARCAEVRERAGETAWAVVGRGSSGHAATYFTYAMMLAQGRAPIDIRPWAVHAAAQLVGWRGTTVVGLSASGQSTDVADAVERLRRAGARTVAVVNANGEDTLLGGVADDVIDLAVGPETAVPATKSFTSQLVVAALLAGLGDSSEVAAVARCLEQLAAQDASAEGVAQFVRDARRVVYLARGPALAAAEDAALKLAEAAGVPGQAWSAAEVLHGPVASLDSRDRVVLLADRSDMSSTTAAAAALARRGVPFMTVGCWLPGASAEAQWELTLPDADWARTPVLAAFGQQVALRAALALGRDPDHPLGLSKVTLTM